MNSPKENLNHEDFYQFIPEKEVPWICEWKSEICESLLKIENNCNKCKEKLRDLLSSNKENVHVLALSNYLKLSFEEKLEFIITRKIRRKNFIGKYIPDQSNAMAKPRSLKNNKIWFEDLTLWEIFFTIKRLETIIKENHERYFQWVDNLSESMNNEKYLSTYIRYNTSKKDYWFDINYENRPKNEAFSKSIKVKKISTMKLTNKKWEEISVNQIPALCINSNRYDSLQDKLNDYISNPDNLKKDTNWEFELDESNKKILSKYIKEVEKIHWVIESNNYQANTYVKNIFQSWKKERDWNNFKDIKWDFQIAPTKRFARTMEKAIINSDWDLERLTDLCRWIIIFENISDLSSWCIKILDILKKHNKKPWIKNSIKEIKEVLFADKFWDLYQKAEKPSWYRDWKFLIKLWDWNVIELMLQIKEIKKAKDEWFDSANWISMNQIVKKLKFSKTEIKKINEIISTINPDWTTRWEQFKSKNNWTYTLPDFSNLSESVKFPADFIFNIYRNLPKTDPKKISTQKNLQGPKKIESLTLIEKLHLLETEIYKYWYKLAMDKTYKKVKKRTHNKNDNNLREKLK